MKLHDIPQVYKIREQTIGRLDPEERRLLALLKSHPIREDSGIAKRCQIVRFRDRGFLKSISYIGCGSPIWTLSDKGMEEVAKVEKFNDLLVERRKLIQENEKIRAERRAVRDSAKSVPDGPVGAG